MRPVPQQRTSPLQIDIQTQSPLWDAQPLAAQTVREAIGAAATALSTAGGEVSIVLTNDSAIRTLNRDWRGIDKPTNVLSFPASGQAAGEGGSLLGDIVIAYETLERECDDENRDLPSSPCPSHGAWFSSSHRLRSSDRCSSRRDGRARKQDHDAPEHARPLPARVILATPDRHA